MKCPHCSREIVSGAFFCGNCGQKIEQDFQERADSEPVEPSDFAANNRAFPNEDAVTRIEVPREEKVERVKAQAESAGIERIQAPGGKPRIPVWLWIILAAFSILGLLTVTGVLGDLFSPSPINTPKEDRYVLDLMPLADVPRLQPGVPIILTAGWITEEEEQAEDFLDAIERMEITLNGVELPNVMSGWQGIEMTYYSAENEEYPAAIFEYNLGTLDPGMYKVDTLVVLSRDHDDGFDVYSAGVLWDWEIEFEVLEN